MWHDHPFMHSGNRKAERTVGMGVGGGRKKGGLNKIWKRGEQAQYGGHYKVGV